MTIKFIVLMSVLAFALTPTFAGINGPTAHASANTYLAQHAA